MRTSLKLGNISKQKLECYPLQPTTLETRGLPGRVGSVPVAAGRRSSTSWRGGPPLYPDLRGEYGEIKEDKELVELFSKVLERREQLGELDREEQEQEEQEKVEVATRETTSVPASPQPGAGQLSNTC